MRIEVTMAPDGDRRASRNGASAPIRTLAPPPTCRRSRRSRSTATSLEWTITLTNHGARPVEIGDLAVPFNFAERTGARGDIYTTKLLRHAFVGGHGSWVYWQRSNGEGPYLVMTPSGPTKFEYFDSSGRRVHAVRSRARPRAPRRIAAGGNWRLPVSSLTLAPKGAPARRDLHVPVPVGEGFRRRA